MSVAMFRAPAGFTPKSTSGFVTILEARKKGIGAVLAESNARREHPGLAQHALPGNLAAIPVDGQQAILVHGIGEEAVFLDFDGGLHIEVVAPEDRRGVAATGDRRLPADILVFAPMDRRIARIDQAV